MARIGGGEYPPTLSSRRFIDRTMQPERRNHYRVLQVRSDAHPEVIAASYRRLMTRLKQQPDPADEYTTAARLNEAYAVLSHPRRRSEYDARRSMVRRPAHDAALLAGPGKPARTGTCPFCAEKAPAVISASSRCESCGVPLAPVIRTGPLSMPCHGRVHVRTPQSDFFRMRLQQGGPVQNARLRDLSAGGLSFYYGKALEEGCTLYVMAPQVEAVAQVVRVGAHGPLSIIHARMLTACHRNRTVAAAAATA